ncbi:serine-threonine protein kinase, putative [Entamoeba invadens IP1]|uniref:Serine-threonine protein kinase, putative n=1 Tax=Entamoeba invadens IP1 TaxID=370355 RepID=A0A0A1UEV3_ENTIV|nr:serine-threonine protein kinase, putative [Entamoeba invadens IP1]ELP92465.1 serine-threonine protein kinase, putative [Entamoeba invadens IP1]|eukprot:XP_004259236.1 serine-threonine protein kinase, putative [Entamoeba invadens IP1]
MNSSYTQRNIRVPKKSPYPNEPDRQFNYYLFISVTNFCDVKLQISVDSANGKIFRPFLTIDQKYADDLFAHIGVPLSVYFPMQNEGFFGYPACIGNDVYKTLFVEVEFTGNYSLLFDGRKNNRMQFFQQILIEKDDQGIERATCVDVWVGERFGALAEKQKEGILVRVEGQSGEHKTFSFFSKDQDYDIEIDLSAICPDDCGSYENRGRCLPSERRCVCNPSYGGDDCHKVCYYDRKWLVDNTNLCYFGAPGCDQYCHCNEGYIEKNHYCITPQCLAGKPGPKDECIAGTEACLENCQCLVKGGFVPTYEKLCKSKLCGNSRIDDLYDSSNVFMRREECDNGTNCNKYCRCLTGYITDPKDPKSCIKKEIGIGVIVSIVVGAVVVFIVILAILIFVLTFLLRYEKIDINIFKQQQPTYHLYISGSIRASPGKSSKYKMDPIDLDFGNETKATEIQDTRFQQIEVHNFSKKHMMIIFHTTNSKKFIFHFEPQVLHLTPHSKVKIVTVYMTIFCTTKIRDMKLPYTVWTSSSKYTLNDIAMTLKDKSFENWTNDDEKKMTNLLKGVKMHMHYNLMIKTDSASSTHIDLDELNMSENPIAEGAMGKVYIGSYRSVPVAIKQFRWENLNEEEMLYLKKNVIQECEMMSKLRNPFIANYMGSVTYIPQVSMVIQFFVLGSLAEYLRSEKDFYVEFPYKLKVRMLFDTSRGMQFLHENRIMHLDLKPDNLLVNSLDPNSACSIKITDFGTSRFTKKSIKSGEDKGLGTPIYAAPESFKDEYTFAGDVYSFAITAWEIFYQKEPYKEFMSIFEIKNHVIAGRRLKIDEKMPRLYREIINSCWQHDPTKRPGFDQITKMVIVTDEDCCNHCELDNNNTFIEKTEGLINKRMSKMRELLDEEDK